MTTTRITTTTTTTEEEEKGKKRKKSNRPLMSRRASTEMTTVSSKASSRRRRHFLLFLLHLLLAHGVLVANGDPAASDSRPEAEQRMKFARGTENVIECKVDQSLNVSAKIWFNSHFVSVDVDPSSRVHQDNSTGTLTFTNASNSSDSGVYVCFAICSSNSSDADDSRSSGPAGTGTSTPSQVSGPASPGGCNRFPVEVCIFEMPDYAFEVVFLFVLNVILGSVLIIALVKSSRGDKKTLVYDTL